MPSSCEGRSVKNTQLTDGAGEKITREEQIREWGGRFCMLGEKNIYLAKLAPN